MLKYLLFMNICQNGSAIGRAIRRTHCAIILIGGIKTEVVHKILEKNCLLNTVAFEQRVLDAENGHVKDMFFVNDDLHLDFAVSFVD